MCMLLTAITRFLLIYRDDDDDEISFDLDFLGGFSTKLVLGNAKNVSDIEFDVPCPKVEDLSMKLPFQFFFRDSYQSCFEKILDETRY